MIRGKERFEGEGEIAQQGLICANAPIVGNAGEGILGGDVQMPAPLKIAPGFPERSRSGTGVR
jgi:hypothetical protein